MSPSSKCRRRIFRRKRWSACAELMPMMLASSLRPRGWNARLSYARSTPKPKSSIGFLVLLCLLPLFTLSLLSVSFMGDSWKSVASRLNFIRYLGEVGIYSALILLGGIWIDCKSSSCGGSKRRHLCSSYITSEAVYRLP